MSGIIEIQQIITNASLVEKVASTPQTFAINSNSISKEKNDNAGIKKSDTVNETNEVLEPIDENYGNFEENKEEEQKKQEEQEEQEETKTNAGSSENNTLHHINIMV
ncbi:MAG: hypothetical protein ACYCSW_04500 [bacterium]